MKGDIRGIKHVSTRCMGWDPKTGEKKVFDTPEERDVAGWLDHHPKDEAKNATDQKPTNEDKDPPLSRAELLDALKKGGVKHNADATDKQLDNALKGALRKYLADKKVEFTKEDSTRTLLAKVSAPQTESPPQE